jgi:hypothetical protein
MTLGEGEGGKELEGILRTASGMLIEWLVGEGKETL